MNSSKHVSGISVSMFSFLRNSANPQTLTKTINVFKKDKAYNIWWCAYNIIICYVFENQDVSISCVNSCMRCCCFLDIHCNTMSTYCWYVQWIIIIYHHACIRNLNCTTTIDFAFVDTQMNETTVRESLPDLDVLAGERLIFHFVVFSRYVFCWSEYCFTFIQHPAEWLARILLRTKFPWQCMNIQRHTPTSDCAWNKRHAQCWYAIEYGSAEFIREDRKNCLFIFYTIFVLCTYA